MPHEFQFSDAVLQAPVKVLGLKLRPFSVGAEIRLMRSRNPLVMLNGEQFSIFTPESQTLAIRNAALICYRSWAENMQRERWLNLWQWRIRNMDHAQAIEDFLKYRAAGSTYPRPASDEARRVCSGGDGVGRMLGAPFLCRLYSFLLTLPDREIRAFGETAFDFPLGLGTFLYMTHLERDGGCQVENEKEAEVRIEWEKLQAEIPADRRVA